MNFVEYKGSTIAYELQKKKRKTISIRVAADGGVEVSAPLNIDDSLVRDIILKRAEWILQRQRIREQTETKKSIVEGSCIAYLGKEKQVKLVAWDKKRIAVDLNGDEFHLYGTVETLGEEDIIKNAVRAWYINQARSVFEQRVDKYSQIMGVFPKEIKVKAQKTLWGSCSSENKLNFNYKLLLSPLEILDYVVVHELCHIKHKNHSSSFWSMVEEYIPDFREKRDWLRKYGHTLEILEK